jgi:hypothetical protein
LTVSCCSTRSSTGRQRNNPQEIRRRFVAENTAAVVEALYNGARQVDLATEITYEDGRKATLNSSIAIDAIEETRQPVPEPAFA